MTYHRLRLSGTVLLSVSYHYFCQVWRQDADLSRFHLRRTNRFMKCDMCVQLRSSLRDCYVSGTLSFHVQQLRRRYLEHLSFVKSSRAAYWDRKREAARHPERSLSIIIDGSDQVQNGCPYFSEKTHAMEGCPKFRLHAYGVLVHGKQPYVYLVQDHVKQGRAYCTLELVFMVDRFFFSLL